MADSNQIKTFFEDQHLIVLSKPAGLLSQGDASGEENLVDLLRVRFGRNYVGLIHRLDRNTSGLMVVAKRTKSAERLTAQLQKGELVRQYHAVLWGELKGEHRWEHWLQKNEKTNEVKTVAPHTPNAKIAVLKVTSLKNFIHPNSKDPLTVAEFQLETGRSHQIRAQSAASHHPIIGDTKYGSARTMTLFSRPALHSCFLSFNHPMTNEKLTLVDAFPDDLRQAFSTQLE